MRQALITVIDVACMFLLVKVAYDWLERRAGRKKSGRK
jgi:hypothetical protein